MRHLAMIAVAVGAFLSAHPLCAQDGWGTIKGRVVWGPKDLPERKPIASVDQNGDKAHCLKDGPVLDEVWIVNKKSRGLQWTFLWLINDDPKDKTPLPIHPKLQE